MSTTFRLVVFSSFNRQRLTVNEILDILDEENDIQDVYIEPPDVSEWRDEESGDDEAESALQPENLSGNQLLAPAEIRGRSVDDYSQSLDTDE